ncbi:unnamed protein product [Brassica oleracea]
MEYPVGVRFCPTVDEIFGHYLRLKNLGGDTSRVDEVISTVDIYSFEPFELPRHSRMESSDQVYYFFVRRQNKYKRGEKQRRQTTFGYWKITGHPTEIMRKGGDGEKIGEKRVLMFYESEPKSKSDWVMHEYTATLMPPTHQMMTTYTVCKVMFKGDPKDLPTSSSFAGQIQHHHLSLIPQFNSNSSGGLSTESESSFELQDPRLFSGFLYLEEDAHFEDETLRDLNSLPNNDDAEEEEWLVNLWSMQGDRNDHRPKMPLTGFISDDDDDDSDSDSISTKTCSIKSSSTCVTFGNSNRLIDQIIDLPESPRSTIESVSLTQEVSKALGANSAISEKKMSPCDDDAQVSEIGGDQMGQEMVIKNKRAGFIYRMIQKFAKKIKLCSCVSRT